MRQWLVKWLGGFTEEEMDSEIVEVSEVEFLRAEILAKDKEIARLTNLMLVRSGFLIQENTSQNEIKHEPINKRQSWAQRQKELERQDAKKYADQTEAYWKEKEEKTNAS